MKLNIFPSLQKCDETFREFVFLFENESVSAVRRLFNDAAAAGKMIIME